MVLPNEQKIALSDTISPKEIIGDKANATKIITKVTPTLNTEEDSNKTVTPPRLDNSIALLKDRNLLHALSNQKLAHS